MWLETPHSHFLGLEVSRLPEELPPSAFRDSPPPPPHQRPSSCPNDNAKMTFITLPTPGAVLRAENREGPC